MRNILFVTTFIITTSASFAPLHADDNETLFQALIPDNASLSAVKESGSKTLDASEDVLENVVEDGKSFGSFLFKKANELVDDTKNTFKNLTE